MPFKSEEALLKVVLQTPFIKKLSIGDNRSALVEPKGLFGIPDVLTIHEKKSRAKEITSSSFEVKLRNWKRALVQAFKYKAFSEFSYVVIDHHYASPAIKNIPKFKQANIGLISIDNNGKIYFHVKPSKEEPYCETCKAQVFALVQPQSKVGRIKTTKYSRQYNRLKLCAAV